MDIAESFISCEAGDKCFVFAGKIYLILFAEDNILINMPATGDARCNMFCFEK